MFVFGSLFAFFWEKIITGRRKCSDMDFVGKDFAQGVNSGVVLLGVTRVARIVNKCTNKLLIQRRTLACLGLAHAEKQHS